MTDQTPRTATLLCVNCGDRHVVDVGTEALDVEVLAEAMASSDGVKWPRSWVRNDAHQFSWIARQVATRYRAILAGETER